MVSNKWDITSLDIKSDVYDKILKKSTEFLAAQKSLGPYIRFGLSNLHGYLTLAIGKYLCDFLNFCP